MYAAASEECVQDVAAAAEAQSAVPEMRIRHRHLHKGHMTTPLDRSIKRELELDGTRYTVTISPEGIKVTEKGKRKARRSPGATLSPAARRYGATSVSR
jgi:hypothetical protein